MKPILKMMFFLFGITFVSAQQTYSVSGTVYDFHDKTFLKDAKIQLGNYSTLTDAKGHFALPKVPAGTYTLVASHALCETLHKEITINRNLDITLTLEHHEAEIETVTIHGAHKNNGAIVVKTLDRAEIEKNTTENLGNLLAKISGVSTLKTGNNIVKPIIHGLYGSRISILNNGVKLAEQEWGIEHAPNVDINSFQHIDVIKGASALKYGSDAIGGVVILEPEVIPAKDTLKGNIGLTGIFNGRGLALDLNLIKSWKNGWAVKTAGSMKKLGDEATPDYNLKNTGTDFSSFNFSLQHNTFKKGLSLDYYLTNQNLGILRDSHVSSKNDYARAMAVAVPVYSGKFSYDIQNPRQLIEHHIAKVAAYNRFENIGKVTAIYSFQYNHRQEFDIRRGPLNAIPSMDLALVTHQFNLNNLLERQKFSWETGLDGMYQNNYSDPATEARRLIPNYDKFSAGIYSVFKYKISQDFNAEAGLRYDYNRYEVTKWYDKSDWERYYAATFPQFYIRTNANRVLTKPSLDYHNLSYNAGLEYHPSGNFNLKFNYAKVGRTPNIAELFSDGLHHSAAIIERGNMNIKNEVGHQFNMMIDMKLNLLNGLQISANPYYFITKNFINQVPNGVIQPTQYGTFPVWLYQQIDATMYGLDVDVNFHLTDQWSYKGGASYVYGQDDTHDVPLILMMPPNFTNALQVNVKKWNDFYLTLENRTVLHQKRYPVIDISYTDYENGEEVTKTLDFSTPPKAYSLWNVQAGINLSKNFTAGLSVNNILNTAYRDYLNRMRYFANDPGRNFILSFRYKF